MYIGKSARRLVMGLGLVVSLPAVAGTTLNTTGATLDRRFVMQGSSSCYTSLHIGENSHSWAHGPDEAFGAVVDDVFDFGSISSGNPPSTTNVGGAPYVTRDTTDGGINIVVGVYVNVDSMGCGMSSYTVDATYDHSTDGNVTVILGSYTQLHGITNYTTAPYVLPWTGGSSATIATGVFDGSLGEETAASLDVGVHLHPLALANPFQAGVRFTLTPAF